MHPLPRRSIVPAIISSVVPGYVVLSSTTSCPARTWRAIASIVATTARISGT